MFTGYFLLVDLNLSDCSPQNVINTAYVDCKEQAMLNKSARSYNPSLNKLNVEHALTETSQGVNIIHVNKH